MEGEKIHVQAPGRERERPFRRHISYADQPVALDIAINKFPTDTAARQSFPLVGGSKHLSLRLIGGRRAGSGTTAAYCLSVFHYSQCSADDGERKDYTSG